MRVNYYHGETPELRKRLEEICKLENGEMVYNGSLDEFRIKFPNFLIMGENIFVTHRNNFGQA